MVVKLPTPKKGDERTFKGKKKVKTIEDKVKKGLHLNKQDRRKLVKSKAVKEFQEEVNRRVKQELETLDATTSRQRSLSSCSESSFGSAPAPKKTKAKRVSFSAELERLKEFDKKVDPINAKASSASPGRSILSRNSDVSKSSKKVNVKSEPVDEKEKVVDKSKSTLHGTISGKVAKQAKIQVTKKTKEQLLAMPRKERRKFLLELRQQQKPQLEVAARCKKLWEKARMGKTPQEERDRLVSELIGLVKGNAIKLVYLHDMSRVFQFLYKLGREGVTSMIFNEVSPELVRMSMGQYSRYFVKRMLKYGTKQQRDIIIDSFRGHCVRLMSSIYSATILEDIYNEYADARQRYDIVIEFYGPEFIAFRPDKIQTLSEILAEAPAKRPQIMKNVEQILIEKCTEKITLRHSLVHKLMFDLMEHGDREQKLNLLDSIKDKIPEIVHTPNGSRVAMRCVWLANVKDRKLIVKNFKDLSVRAACEKYGQRVLFAIFDQVDDTTLINKYITAEIANDVGTVMREKWGVLCLEYMVHPRDERSMDVDMIKELQKGDGNEISKKDKKDRYAEIFKHLSTPLLTFLAANMDEMLFGAQAPLTTHIVRKALELPTARELFDRHLEAEDRIKCNEAIAELAKKDFIPMDPSGFHMVEHQYAGYVLSLLVRQDDKLPENERLALKLSELPVEGLSDWVGCNKGCFVLLRMFENGGSLVQKRVKAAVDVRRLARYNYVGAKLLYKALTGEEKPECEKPMKKEVKGEAMEDDGEDEVASDESDDDAE